MTLRTMATKFASELVAGDKVAAAPDGRIHTITRVQKTQARRYMLDLTSPDGVQWHKSFDALTLLTVWI
jgi:hypothetical protein